MKSEKLQKRDRLSFEEIGLLGSLKYFLLGASAFRRVEGVDLPKDGRSSVDSGDGLLSGGPLAFGSRVPRITNLFQILADLEKLSSCNPDFSQMVGNIVALGNTGHSVTVDAPTENAAAAALTRINESASRLYPNSAGIDGLINQYLRQSAVTGAISSEDVIDFTGRRVEKVVIVPVEEIRFRRIDGADVPHQQPRNFLLAQRKQQDGSARNPLGLIRLNPNTYRFYALENVQNCPYARPPAIAAVDLLNGPQKHAIENLKFILDKFGLLGFVTAKVTRDKQRHDESNDAYKSRMQTFLQNARELLTGSLHRGLLIAFDNFKFEHSNVASDGRGAGEVFQTLEELIMSGMGTMAAFAGRNYTTTETFADVVYNILVSQMGNHQRLAKRRVERTYDLDLMLAGIPFDDVSITFNAAESRNALQTAQAEQIRQQMAFERCEKGLTSPDQCAQEQNYDGYFDSELISKANPAVAANSGAGLWAKRAGFSATFRFDRQSQRYRFAPLRIELASTVAEAGVGSREPGDRVIDFKKKAA